VRSSSKVGWAYYAERPTPYEWVDEEEAAKPLLGESDVGELSVSFIPGLKLWIMMYGGGLTQTPLRIFAKFALSPYPWGPWTKYDLDLTEGNAFGQANQGPYGFYIIDRFTRWDDLNHQATLYFTVSENDLGGTNIYRTHLVKSVLTFQPIIEVPSAAVTVSPSTVTSGEDATVTLTLAHPFSIAIGFKTSIYYPGVASVSFSSDPETIVWSKVVVIDKGDTEARFQLFTQPRTSTFVTYTVEIHAEYMNEPGTPVSGALTVEPTVKDGILSGLTLFANTVRGGRSVQGEVTLEEAVATDTPVSVVALDPGGGPESGPSDAVSLDPLDGVVTVPHGSTMKQFTINANNVPNTRQVTIVANAVVAKRAHLTVERSG
jgi:hypothetical protein